MGGLRCDSPVWPELPFLKKAFDMLDEEPVDPAKPNDPPIAKASKLCQVERTPQTIDGRNCRFSA